MAEKKKVTRKRVGARAGKADLATKSSGLETALTGSKFQSGGSKMKARKGGIIRKPVPKIRYKRTTD